MEQPNNASSGSGSKQECGNPAGSPEGKGQNDCPINVTLVVRNQILPSFFEYRQIVTQPPQSRLIRYLEAAADKDPHFKFNATYFPSPLGYFIIRINGLNGNWRILGSDGQLLQLGVSSYVPEDGEVITFDSTEGDQCL